MIVFQNLGGTCLHACVTAVYMHFVFRPDLQLGLIDVFRPKLERHKPGCEFYYLIGSYMKTMRMYNAEDVVPGVS